MLTDGYESLPADLGYVPDVSAPLAVAEVRNERSMVGRVNAAITATTVGFAAICGEAARHTGESVTQTRLAVLGTGAFLIAAYNSYPIAERFEAGRRLISRSQIAAEQAKFESQQRQRRIDDKNVLRAPMKRRTRDLVTRTKAIRRSNRTLGDIPGEALF